MLFIGAAVVILAYSWQMASRSTPVLAADAAWGGVPVGGLSTTEAAERVKTAYSVPIELRYRGQVIQAAPETLGFQLDTGAMAEIANRGAESSWWERIWNKPVAGSSVDLQFTLDGNVLRSYLQNEIVPRYDQPLLAPQPIPGTTNFTPGTPGWQLDVQASAVKVGSTLQDLSNRSVDLVVRDVSRPSGDMGNLEIFLKQTIANTGFDGIAEVYLQQPNSGDILHFAVDDNADIPVDIAFSAASTIKIPIMVSILRRTAEPTPEEVKSQLERMIEFSENPPADALMQAVIDETAAPLQVTSDMQDGLGLKNTFLAGYFYFGADLLKIYDTPANTRTDVDLDPDIYNQTTASDMGTLMTGIYTCSKGEESILTQAFPGEISQPECQYMLDILAKNKIGVLSEAGVPDGMRVSHKHGWTEEADGYLHTVSDVGIVFSPDADFVFAVYLYDFNQLLFDPADALVAQLIQVMYNYYNPQNQETWLGEAVAFPQNY